MIPVSLAVFFAVPHEAALFKKKLKIQWQKKEFGLFFSTTNFNHQLLLVACLGMGEKAVKKNLTFLLEHYSFPEAILAGYAGALDPKLKIADVILSSSQPFILPNLIYGKIISINEVAATIEIKQKLFQQTGASICDMEYETVSSLCSQYQILLHSLRGVSDVAHENLPVTALNRAYNLKKQRPAPFKLFLYLLSKPSEISLFFSFVKNLSQTQNALTQRLWCFLEKKFNSL